MTSVSPSRCKQPKDLHAHTHTLTIYTHMHTLTHIHRHIYTERHTHPSTTQTSIPGWPLGQGSHPTGQTPRRKMDLLSPCIDFYQTFEHPHQRTGEDRPTPAAPWRRLIWSMALGEGSCGIRNEPFNTEMGRICGQEHAPLGQRLAGGL